jgi:hypothetical protein
MENPIKNVDLINYITKLKGVFQNKQIELKKYIEQPSDQNFKLLENLFKEIQNI